MLQSAGASSISTIRSDSLPMNQEKVRENSLQLIIKKKTEWNFNVEVDGYASRIP